MSKRQNTFQKCKIHLQLFGRAKENQQHEWFEIFLIIDQELRHHFLRCFSLQHFIEGVQLSIPKATKRGGGPFFPVVGDVLVLVPMEICTTCNFPWGSGSPVPPPLDPPLNKMLRGEKRYTLFFYY